MIKLPKAVIQSGQLHKSTLFDHGLVYSLAGPRAFLNLNTSALHLKPHVGHHDLIHATGILISVPPQTSELPTLQTLQSQEKMLVLHHSQPNPGLLYPMLTTL